MEVSIVFMLLLGFISFILSLSATVINARAKDPTDIEPYLGFSLLAMGFSLVFNVGILIHYLIVIYPVISAGR